MKHLIVASVLMTSLSLSAQPMRYQVTDLWPLGELGAHSPIAVNEIGEAAGTARAVDGTTRAHAYRDGKVVDLGTLDGGYSEAYAIDRRGHVTGYSTAAAMTAEHAVLFRPQGIADLGAHVGSMNSKALGMNDHHDAVGWMASLAGHRDAFLYRDHRMVTLEGLGGRYSTATGINDSGQIVGWFAYDTFPYYQRAFLYENGVMKDLGAMGANMSQAMGINRWGAVVGWAGKRPFLYHDGAMRDLGLVRGFDACWGLALNSHEDVVGWCSLGLPEQYQAYLHRRGKNHNLNRMLDPVSGKGWTLEIAFGINDKGQIVGNGRHHGEHRAFLLTPMPD